MPFDCSQNKETSTSSTFHASSTSLPHSAYHYYYYYYYYCCYIVQESIMPCKQQKQTYKGVISPSPPPGKPSVQDQISQLKFAARLQCSHEMRGGKAISIDNDVAEEENSSTKASKKSKRKSLFNKPRFLAKSA